MAALRFLRRPLRIITSSIAIFGVFALNVWAADIALYARNILPIHEERAHQPLVSVDLPSFDTGPVVSEPVVPSVSPAVRDLPSVSTEPPAFANTSERERPNSINSQENIVDVADPLAGRVIEDVNTPNPLFTVDGVNNLCNCSPPDTVGDVGPNHYVQMANATTFSIFNKTGGAIVSNVALNSLWSSGNCASSDNGDPIVLWDSMANRWLLAQFSTGNGICVAVSQTADPTGSYYGYEFTFPSFPDYFKISVWPDAYYIGINESNYTVAALDRSKMLLGQAAGMVRFDPGLGNFAMPADMDGPTAPPANAPGYFYTFLDDTYHGGGGVDRLEVYAFRVNWTTPASSSFVLSTTIPIANYTYTVCGFFVLSCIPQSGTTRRVDPVSEWPMYHLPYRNFGTHEVMVGNFAVDVGGDRAGIRWFELRKTAGNWTLYQEGTHAPNDGLHRWMGSIAMDKNGNIALGYSRSSTNTFPSLYIATRAPGDTLGALQTEALFFAGGGSQTGNTRWGDYSTMSVDPTDDCTFWFTSEYYAATTSNAWRTRLGAFRMPDCNNSPYGLSLSPATAGQAANPGQVVTYTLAVTNTGSASDTFTVTLSGNAFSTSAPASVGPLAAGASTTFNVVVTIPGGASGGATDAVNVNVKSWGDPTKQANATLTTTVNTLRGLSLSPATTGQSGNPGQMLTYTLAVTNTGNASDTFTVTLSGNAFGTTAPTSVGPLAAGASTTFNVFVTVPGGALAGASDTVNVNVKSRGDPTKQANATLTTSVNAIYGVSLAVANPNQSNYVGQVVTYTFTLTNSGNTTDTYTVNLAGNVFTTTAPSSVGPLAAGASTTFNVVVTIPLSVTNGQLDTTNVTVTSQGNNTVSINTNIVTQAWWRRVYIPMVVK